MIFNVNLLQAGDNNDEIPFEKMKTPTEVKEFVRMFDKLQYSINVERDEDIIQDTTMEYNYLGKDTVNNIKADLISFTVIEKDNMEEIPNSMKFWLGNEKIVQIEIEGELISGDIADMISEQLLSAIFSPFYSFAKMNINEIENMGNVNRGQIKIGDKTYNSISFEIPHTSEMNIKNGIVKLAELNDFFMLVRYDYQTPENNTNYIFTVDSFKLR